MKIQGKINGKNAILLKVENLSEARLLIDLFENRGLTALVDNAASRTSELVTVEGVAKQLLDGIYTLLAFLSDDDAVEAAFVVYVSDSALAKYRHNVLNILIAAGSVKKYCKESVESIRKVAQLYKCDALQWRGRSGWMRFIELALRKCPKEEMRLPDGLKSQAVKVPLVYMTLDKF